VLVAGTDAGDGSGSCGDDDKYDKDGGKYDKDDKYGDKDGKYGDKYDKDDKYGTSDARVYVINPYTGKVEYSFLAYTDKGYSGGVRVAVGDLNNDGTLEVVVAPGAGRVGDVKAFKLDGMPLPGFSAQPFGSKYSDGIEVSLGDVNGDGKDDLVAAKSTGLGDVQVSLSTGSGFTAYRSFVAFPTASKGYDGGATAAVSGINRIVVGSGAGMTPTVKTFNISTVTPTLVSQFQPTFPKYTAGISVTAQNFTGGSALDVVAAAGPNGKSQVSVYNGETNASVVAYNTFASQGKTSPAVYAAASALGSSPIVDTVFMSQGEGGKTSIKKVNATTGVVDPTFAVTYNGKPLVGPLRIATNLRPPLA
jgi:serralysin